MQPGTNAKYHTLDFFLHEDIGHLLLKRPPGNVMDFLFFRELNQAVAEEIPASGIKALIVSAEGRHFSSGTDLQEMLGIFRNKKQQEMRHLIHDYLEKNNKTFLSLFLLDIPVVAALKGICLGSAFELAMFCHARICTDNTWMGLPESSFNLIPGCGGISRLTTLTGKAKAIELILSGRSISAEEAKELNIIFKIVPKQELITEAEKLAKQLAAKREMFHLIKGMN